MPKTIIPKNAVIARANTKKLFKIVIMTPYINLTKEINQLLMGCYRVFN